MFIKIKPHYVLTKHKINLMRNTVYCKSGTHCDKITDEKISSASYFQYKFVIN